MLRNVTDKVTRTENRGGWIHKLLMWHWHEVSLAGYPAWDLVEGHPPFVKLRHVNKGTKSSDEIANEWDSDPTCLGHFYNRDWSDDGSVFVGDGEGYTSGWWFERASDRDTFVAKYEALVIP